MTDRSNGRPALGGRFIRTVNRFTAWLYSMLATGLFGRLFTSYDRWE